MSTTKLPTTTGAQVADRGRRRYTVTDSSPQGHPQKPLYRLSTSYLHFTATIFPHTSSPHLACGTIVPLLPPVTSPLGSKGARIDGAGLAALPTNDASDMFRL